MTDRPDTASQEFSEIIGFIEHEREFGWNEAKDKFPALEDKLMLDEYWFTRYLYQKREQDSPRLKTDGYSFRTFLGEEDQTEEAAYILAALEANAPMMDKICFYRYNSVTREYQLLLLKGVQQRWLMLNTTHQVTKLWVDQYRSANAPEFFVYQQGKEPKPGSFPSRERIRCGMRFFIPCLPSDKIPDAILFLNSTTYDTLSRPEIDELTGFVEKITPKLLDLKLKTAQYEAMYGVVTYANRSFNKVNTLKSLSDSLQYLSEEIEQYFKNKKLTVLISLFRYVSYADLLEVCAGPKSLKERKFIEQEPDSLEAFALHMNRPLLIEDLKTFAKFIQDEYKNKRPIRVRFGSGIVIPFCIDEDRALLVVGAAERDAFRQDDLHFLRDLCDIVSSSVERHRESRYKQQLDKFNELSEALLIFDQHQPDELGPLLNRLCEHILEISGSHAVSIALCENYEYEKGTDFTPLDTDLGRCKIVDIDNWKPSARGHSWWIVNNLKGLLIQNHPSGDTNLFVPGTERWIIESSTNSIRRENHGKDELPPEGGIHPKSEGVLTQIGLPLFQGSIAFGVLWVSFLGRRHYLEAHQIESLAENRQYRVETAGNEFFSRHDISILSIFSKAASLAIFRLTEERRKLKPQFNNKDIKFLLKHPKFKDLTTYDHIVALRADIIATSKVINYLSSDKPINLFKTFIKNFIEEMGRLAIEAGSIVISNEDHVMGIWALAGRQSRKLPRSQKSQVQACPELFQAIECGLKMQEIYKKLRAKLIDEIGDIGIPWKDLLNLFISIDYDPKSKIIAGFASSKIMSRFTALGATIANVNAMQCISNPKEGVYLRSGLRSSLEGKYNLKYNVRRFTDISQVRESLDRIQNRKGENSQRRMIKRLSQHRNEV